jgi:DNA (cytosine-5)-methyltransferase 1
MSNFTYKWNLTDLDDVEKNNYNVFSCFACGGGSTMGYKMSGFNVVGCNEIDPEMIKIYKNNHNPKFAFLESIETFKLRNDLPKELYNLDILDGSPPCSSFSMAGSREKAWGKNKKFREGQADQVLDDLFFHYIDLARKLQPKIVVAENVKGMLQGNAKGYVKQIINLYKVAGYDVQLFLLNGATMGLPQKRERVFFVCTRKDLNLPKLNLGFNEKPISVSEAFRVIEDINYKGKDYSASSMMKYYNKCKSGESFAKYHPKGSLFGQIKLPKHKPCGTLTSKEYQFWHYDSPRGLSRPECCVLSSFPLDYKFKTDQLAKYQVGMSVPPLMMHKISEQIKIQLLDKL